MSNGFNIRELEEGVVGNNRYQRRLSELVAAGKETSHIEHVVNESTKNIQKGEKSFVIYGEPQSGKTEMMIALTAKLLDEGSKIIIVLLNDSVQLLGQNLERFQRSGLSPAPKKSSEVLSESVEIGDGQWVIFSKKNARDLEKLIDKLPTRIPKIVIDDEADYATPNSRVNKERQKQSKINELTEKLLRNGGTYIGVTATPARLDLNRTHGNKNQSWVFFPAHQNYTGQEQFFPASLSKFPFILKELPDKGDDPAYLRKALFSFMVNVAYLNTQKNSKEKNYSFLVHTSGQKADHTVDYEVVQKAFEVLRDSKNTKYEKYYEDIFNIASDRYPAHAKEITRYILGNNTRSNIVVMNSDKENNAADNRTATDPTSPFTIAIGGNIVSRGVTFENLLGMFFTRDVKHRMQQDVYIQRARMFGSRNEHLKYFELTIPKTLYLNWHKCFIFHRLSLDSIERGNGAPVWLEGSKIATTASSSIDRTRVVIDSGEMSFDLFEYSPAFVSPVADILNSSSSSNLQKVKALSKLLGDSTLPQYLIDYIETFLPAGDSSIAIHEPGSISGYKDNDSIDKDKIIRSRGFIGQREMEIKKFPDAIHHINILYNENGKARVFYKYQGNIRFLKTS